MIYKVIHGDRFDCHEIKIRSTSIKVLFWGVDFWEWDLGIAWNSDFKGFILPFMTIQWHKSK